MNTRNQSRNQSINHSHQTHTTGDLRFRLPAIFPTVPMATIGLLALLVFPLPGQTEGKQDSLTLPQVMAWAEGGARPKALAKHDAAELHDILFSLMDYEGTQTCIMCHSREAADVLEMGHFKWQGETENIVGLEGESHGKIDLINNFCIAVSSNEPRCSQCHAGYGYTNKDFDFDNPENIDCLVCHDQTGTYKKGKTSGGFPDPSVDLQLVARNIATNHGRPTRKACLDCHAKAGGGDNVKHGDLSTDLVTTTREFDVHMGTDGANMVCVDCHAAKYDAEGAVVHGIAGMSLHSTDEGDMKQCTDCHGERSAIHQGTSVEAMIDLGLHDRLACQVCHIPAIARAVSTKVEWYWADAGQDLDPIPIDPATGRPTYDKKKGSFVWENNVRPTLRYANGKWMRKVLASSQYDSEPVDLGSPLGDHNDPDAMIYPFKLMVGNQPMDDHNQSVTVPHLFGMGPGPNPYWASYDWNAALTEGASYSGQDFSGNHDYVETSMLLSVNHEIAAADQALGQGRIPMGCVDCHHTDFVDWPALGWTNDPLKGGSRVE